MREDASVASGDALVEIITSKAAFDVEAPTDGVVLRITAPEKSVVPVGYVLAVIGSPGEAVPQIDAENERLLEEFRNAALAQAETGRVQAGRARMRATPGARRLAKAEQVDLGDVPSSRDNGVICEDDVRRFLRYRRKDQGGAS